MRFYIWKKYNYKSKVLSAPKTTSHGVDGIYHADFPCISSGTGFYYRNDPVFCDVLKNADGDSMEYVTQSKYARLADMYIYNIDEVINTKDNSKPYICSICTCGDDVGLAMDTMRKDLSLRGLTLNSAWSLKMPESYVALPFMYTDNKEREQEKISVATAKMEDIIKAVKEHKIGVWDVYRGPCAWLKTHVIGRWFNHYRITDNKFHVDADKCSHCGTCSKKCPVRNITLIDGVPSWKGNGICTACLACYHHCPHHAINYGHWTKTRGQYYKK